MLFTYNMCAQAWQGGRLYGETVTQSIGIVAELHPELLLGLAATSYLLHTVHTVGGWPCWELYEH